MKASSKILILALCLSLCACTSAKRSIDSAKRSFDKVEVSKGSSDDVIKAAKDPIYDTNLIKKKIPEALKNIATVYQPPVNCTEYWRELAVLNEALGEDLVDTKMDVDDAKTINLTEAISSSLTPGIPLGSLVRSLSGAKKHELKRLNAIFRGKSRRSYIKGWASGRDC